MSGSLPVEKVEEKITKQNIDYINTHTGNNQALPHHCNSVI